jgi:hypothetical protein
VRLLASAGSTSTFIATSFNLTLPAILPFTHLNCTFLPFLFRFPFVLNIYVSLYSSSNAHSPIASSPTVIVPIPQSAIGILSLSIVLVSTDAQSIHISCVRLAKVFISTNVLVSRNSFLNVVSLI